MRNLLINQDMIMGVHDAHTPSSEVFCRFTLWIPSMISLNIYETWVLLIGYFLIKINMAIIEVDARTKLYKIAMFKL